GAATGAAHRDEDVLLLLLVEIGAIEHRARLLREQVVQREAACLGLIIRRRWTRAAKRLGRWWRRESRGTFARTLGAGHGGRLLLADDVHHIVDIAAQEAGHI